MGSIQKICCTVITALVREGIDVMFKGVTSGYDIISNLNLPSPAPLLMLATSCPNLQHLTINQVFPETSVQPFSTLCPMLTSLKLADFFGDVESLQRCLTQVPQITHLTILFKQWWPSRESFMQASDVIPILKYLNLGERCMGRMQEWQALPEGLLEVKFLFSQPPLPPLGLLVLSRYYLQTAFRPPRFDEHVEHMLGIRSVVADNFTNPYVHPVLLTCTRVVAGLDHGQTSTWACTKAVRYKYTNVWC